MNLLHNVEQKVGDNFKCLRSWGQVRLGGGCKGKGKGVTENKLPLRAMLISLGLFCTGTTFSGRHCAMFSMRDFAWFPWFPFMLYVCWHTYAHTHTHRRTHLLRKGEGRRAAASKGGGVCPARTRTIRERKCLAALIIIRLKVSTCFSQRKKALSKIQIRLGLGLALGLTNAQKKTKVSRRGRAAVGGARQKPQQIA